MSEINPGLIQSRLQMQPDPDRALVDAAAEGNRDAFGELVSRYQVRIVNFARAVTSEAGEADDLAQETFIRAYKAIGRFRGESTFRTWLYRIATNVVQSHLKSRSRRWLSWNRKERDPQRGDTSEASHEPAVGATFEDAVVRRQAIDRALASLPPELRIAVTLCDIQGLEYSEIADALGIPIGTVESRIFRARQRLRPLLADLTRRTTGQGKG